MRYYFSDDSIVLYRRLKDWETETNETLDKNYLKRKINVTARENKKWTPEKKKKKGRLEIRISSNTTCIKQKFKWKYNKDWGENKKY